MLKNIFIILFIFLVSLVFIREDRIDMNTNKYDLNKHGVCVIKNIFTPEEIEHIKDLMIREDYKTLKDLLIHHKDFLYSLKKKTTSDYIFQDYIFIIKKSSIHICHRDSNGDFFNKTQKYPSYTLILYIEDMNNKCLGVIPKSHVSRYKNAINIGDKIINLACNKGDIILFNANLIHVGTLHEKSDHMRIQMKMVHPDDKETIHYYEKYNKILNADNNLPTHLRKAHTNISCMFPILSDITQTSNVDLSRGKYNSKYFSYLFYGNKDFYDLQNAF